MEKEIIEFEDNIIEDNIIEIDCGIGVIKYIEPDNLKLKMIMEDFKSKLELEFINKAS